jgi:hypothetical protein
MYYTSLRISTNPTVSDTFRPASTSHSAPKSSGFCQAWGYHTSFLLLYLFPIAIPVSYCYTSFLLLYLFPIAIPLSYCYTCFLLLYLFPIAIPLSYCYTSFPLLYLFPIAIPLSYCYTSFILLYLFPIAIPVSYCYTSFILLYLFPIAIPLSYCLCCGRCTVMLAHASHDCSAAAPAHSPSGLPHIPTPPSSSGHAANLSASAPDPGRFTLPLCPLPF